MSQKNTATVPSLIDGAYSPTAVDYSPLVAWASIGVAMWIGIAIWRRWHAGAHGQHGTQRRGHEALGKMRIDHKLDFIQSYYVCHRCQYKPWDYFKDLWVPAEGAYYIKCCKARIKTRVPEPPHASYEDEDKQGGKSD